jgi:hypothetical protein
MKSDAGKPAKKHKQRVHSELMKIASRAPEKDGDWIITDHRAVTPVKSILINLVLPHLQQV